MVRPSSAFASFATAIRVMENSRGVMGSILFAKLICTGPRTWPAVFRSLLLSPSSSSFSLSPVVMDTFALPYKAMVLKLFECKRYNEQQVDYLLSDEAKKIITDYAVASDIGKRWLQPTYENNLDALRALVEANGKSFVLPEQRISEDIKTIDDIVKELPVKK